MLGARATKAPPWYCRRRSVKGPISLKLLNRLGAQQGAGRRNRRYLKFPSLAPPDTTLRTNNSARSEPVLGRAG